LAKILKNLRNLTKILNLHAEYIDLAKKPKGANGIEAKYRESIQEAMEPLSFLAV
jgi:hypothetical protein